MLEWLGFSVKTDNECGKKDVGLYLTGSDLCDLGPETVLERLEFSVKIDSVKKGRCRSVPYWHRFI